MNMVDALTPVRRASAFAPADGEMPSAAPFRWSTALAALSLTVGSWNYAEARPLASPERVIKRPAGAWVKPSDRRKYEAEEVSFASDAQSSFDQLLADLGRIENGWASPDSVAPSAEIIRDVQTASIALTAVDLPDVEIDDADGAVTLVWRAGDGSLSLVFRGDGYAVGIRSPRTNAYPAWRLPVDDDSRIAEKLEFGLAEQYARV